MSIELDKTKLREIYTKLNESKPEEKAKLLFKFDKIKDEEVNTKHLNLIANASGFYSFGLELLRAVVQSDQNDIISINKSEIDVTGSVVELEEILIDESKKNIIDYHQEVPGRKNKYIGCIVGILIFLIILIGWFG